jgi:hypothetical protein
MILAWKLQPIVSLYTWVAEINGVYAGSLTTKVLVGMLIAAVAMSLSVFFLQGDTENGIAGDGEPHMLNCTEK